MEIVGYDSCKMSPVRTVEVIIPPKKKKHKQGLYFKDGKSYVNYVMIYIKSSVINTCRIEQLETFIHNLQKMGFRYEQHPFAVNIYKI